MKYNVKYISLSQMESGLFVPADSVIMRLETGAKIICSNFHANKQGKYTVFIFDTKGNCIKTKLGNDFTAVMYKCYTSHQQKIKSKVSTQSIMAHERKHKSGSGGVRLSKWNGQVTDYECTKNPYHDFRRVFITT